MKKKNIVKKIFLMLAIVSAFTIICTGCGKSGRDSNKTGSQNPDSATNGNADSAASATELEVRFGDNGDPFILHLYDNDTAAAVAKHVGTAEWRLPIYHFDDYDNWEVMQYYDVPSRYDIPSNPESITSEKPGEVYYSEPNRIILFFGEAEVSGEYTKVGYFDNTDEFRSAVKNNPTLEGWGNKIVIISPVSRQSDTGSEEEQEPETETAQNSEVKTDIQSAEIDKKNDKENTEQQEVTDMKMKIQIGDTDFMATMVNNSSVDALKKLMADGPLTLNMSDYASMEKGADLGVTLPQNNEQMKTQAGDIILYQGRTFVIYYDTNSWSLTPIGKIDNVDAKELREVLGTGDVTVTLSLV